MSASARASLPVLNESYFEFNVTDPMAGYLTKAAIFTVLAILSLVQLSRQRAWFFWSFTTATALQAIGSITQAYLGYDEVNHTVYVVSVACLTLAPGLLALSAITAYRRLNRSPDLPPRRTGYRTFWMPERAAGLFCTAIQISAITFFLFSTAPLAALHSSSPIEGREGALARLTYEAQALAFLRIGWWIQYIGIVLFVLMIGGSSALDYPDHQSQRLYLAITGVSLLNFARTLGNIEQDSLDLATIGWSGWLFDILPLILAFSLFVKYHPTQAQRTDSEEFDRGAGDVKQLNLPYENPSNC